LKDESDIAVLLLVLIKEFCTVDDKASSFFKLNPEVIVFLILSSILLPPLLYGLLTGVAGLLSNDSILEL
jgi:hypothetical protein